MGVSGTGNPHRAEVVLDLEGERMVLRLSLQALAEIEAILGTTSLSQTGEKLASGALGADGLARILAALARGGGSSISDRALAERIEARHLPAVIGAIADVFVAAFGVEEPPPADPCSP
ncbi:MAG: gene transfer agent family protein [Proteobacteria bacterium]|nr:gene transfer agent family protein [Pseudomonadota bacterium]